MADKLIAAKGEEKETIQRIEPGTKEMEAFLASGYMMTKAEAETIIAERDKNPALYPLDVYLKAKAFLAALVAKPQAVDTNPMWKRSK